MSEPNMITCPSCGAVYEDTLQKCPYCGSVNEKADEQVYMEHLEDIREDLKDLKDTGVRGTVSEAREHGRFVGKVFVTLLIILLALLGFLSVRRFVDRQNARDTKADYLWAQEHYPEMDVLYDAGDYDDLADLYSKYRDEDQYVYDYQHARFLDIYTDIKEIEWLHGLEDKDAIKEMSYASLVYMDLKLETLDESSDFTDEEREILKEHGKPYIGELVSKYGIPQEEVDKIKEKVRNVGYISFDDAQNLADQYITKKEG